MSVNNERQGKVETYISPNSVLCAWMTPESNIKISLTRIERIDCRGQVVQRKEQVTLSEEEACTLRRFFPVIDQFIYFQRFKYISNVTQQARSLSSQASLSAQTSGVQMDLTSSELPNEIQKIIREDSVKKIVYHAKTDHVPANYVLEMHYDFDDDNKPSVYTGYTRYEIYYCSDA